MALAREGEPLWSPDQAAIDASNLQRYMRFVARRYGVDASDYQALWQWSVDHLESFWASIWEYFDIQASSPYRRVLSERTMPGARWFEGAALNYAAHAFRNAHPDRPALLFQSERHPLTAVSWSTLQEQVAAVAGRLQRLGVGPGDRVVAYMPNIPETVIAFLATAAIGAIWSSCSPDFGSRSVIDRFQQIEPKLMFAVDGYTYNGKPFDRTETVNALRSSLPSLRHTILVPYLNPDLEVASSEALSDWRTATASPGTLAFEPVPFEHPLWILFSSGTTGLPKPIVQGHGGILLEHYKILSLHQDLKPGQRFFWFTTTGWMMWNYLISSLLIGVTPVLYDGSPAYPSLDVLWRLAEEAELDVFGTSAPYLTTCRKAGLKPGTSFDFSRLRSLASTGAPLPPEGYVWAYENVKRDLWLASISGGTDLCTAFAACCPLLPVAAGMIQCRALGANLAAFDDEGKPQIDRLGELVITAPMPSMPLYFWNDPDGSRYRESYFETYPGVWRHGDYVRIKPDGSLAIYGRSDATINRQGVRMGTSEIYRAVESLPEIKDSLVVHLDREPFGDYMPLFVVLRDDVSLDEALKQKIKQHVRTNLSPRHVPDDIFAVDEIPLTLNGKKMEIPVKKILLGTPVEKAATRGSIANPDAIDAFVALAEQMRKARQR